MADGAGGVWTAAVVMCAEAVPWRCHRSLIGDAVLARGGVVEDIFVDDGREEFAEAACDDGVCAGRGGEGLVSGGGTAVCVGRKDAVR